MMATDTGIASGAIANCTDGADEVPIVKWEAQARSISGVSSVDYKHSAKNLLVLDFANRTVVTSATYANTTPRDFSKPYIYVGITGNNYFRNDYINSYSYTSDSITVNTKTKGYGIGITLSVDPNTQYRLSYANSASSYLAVGFYDKDGAYINWQACDTSVKHTFTTPSNCVNLMVVFRPNVVDTNYTYANIQMEFGSTTTSYEPPIPIDVKTATLGRTVYGAKLNLTSGTGTENMVRVKISDLSWTYYTGGTNPIFYAQNVSNLKMYSSGVIPNIRIQGFNDPVIAQTRSYQSKNMADLDCSVFEDTSTITFRNTAYNSKDDMLTALGDNYIIYETTQTTDFTFNPILKPVTWGVDNFWINCGDSEVEYYKSGYGFTKVTINKLTSKNFIDNSDDAWESGTINASGVNASGNGTRTKGYFPVIGGLTYCISGITAPSTTSDFRLFYYDANKTFMSYRNYSSSWVFPSNVAYIRFRNLTNIDISNLQLEIGSTPSSYEPYSVLAKTAKLHRRVYGASVDAIRGIGSDAYKEMTIKEMGFSRTGDYFQVSRSSVGAGELTNDNIFCTCYQRGSSSGDKVFWYTDSYIRFRDSDYTTVEAMESAVGKESFGFLASTPTAFTFPPVSFDTIEGEQFLFASEGASALTYRKAVD